MLTICSWSRVCQNRTSTLDRFYNFLRWTETMDARPNKCWCAGLQKSISNGYTRFDPKLTISGQPVNYLDDADFRYLGRPTNIYNSECRCRNDIKTSLLQWLSLVDQLALHTPGKLWLYQHFIVAKMAWFFYCPRSLSHICATTAGTSRRLSEKMGWTSSTSQYSHTFLREI